MTEDTNLPPPPQNAEDGQTYFIDHEGDAHLVMPVDDIRIETCRTWWGGTRHKLLLDFSNGVVLWWGPYRKRHQAEVGRDHLIATLLRGKLLPP